MRTYGRLLKHPATSLALVAAFLGAIPIGMWPLAVVLGVVDRGGSAAEAGLLAAAFGIGNAAGVVTQGALLGRVRVAVLLPAFSSLGIVAAVLLLGDLRVAGAALAGVAIPAITPAVRGRFARTVPGRDRPGAYALVNVLFQAGIAIGPIVAAALATAGLVRWAPSLAAAGGVVAAVLLAVAHRGRIPVVAASDPRAGLAPAPGRGAIVLIAVAAAAGFGIGTLQVLVPVRSDAAISGAAFALLALAEVAAAVLLGGRAGPRHAFRLLVAGTAAMAVVYVLLGAGVPVLPAAVALGAVTSVQSLGSALGLDRFVPPARIPAVFSVQVAVLIVGAAVGSLVAGAAPDAAFGIAAALLALSGTAAAVLAGRSGGPAAVLPGTGHGAHAR